MSLIAGRFCFCFRLGAVAALAAATAGCYSYATMPVEQVRPGEQVRTRVSAARAEQLATFLNREDRTLEGRVLRNASDEVLLEVPVVSVGTVQSERLHQRIEVARPDLLEIEVRQLDRLKTGIFVGSLVAGAAALTIAQFADSGPDVDGPGKGGIDRTLVPLFTVRF